MIETLDYVEVPVRAQALGLPTPTGLCLLPRNFESAEPDDQLVEESSAADVRALLREADIPYERLDSAEDPFPAVSEHAVEWLGPVLFLAGAELSKNPELLNVALGVIANYVTDWFKGVRGEKKVKLDVVVEVSPERTYKRVHYEGPVEGLNEFTDTVRAALPQAESDE